MKRFLSFLLVCTFMMGMLPVVSFAAEPVTVYLDPVNGDNANAGTENAPVQDLAGAYALLQEAGGTVVMLGDVAYTAVTTLPACDYPVTITSKTGAEGIRSNSHIKLAGETTFQNISLTLTKQSTGTCICGNGYKLTMGEGVTTVPFVNSSGSAYYFCLIGGDYDGTVENTDLTVMSGQYRYTYAGGYTGDVTGDAKLTMTGGISANLAPTRTGTVSGDVEMAFSGTATVTGTIYAGAATSGDIGGNSTVTLGQGASFKNLYATSNGSGNIGGTSTVIWDGFDGTFTNLKGVGSSSWTGSVGGSRLVLKSGTVSKAPTDFGTVDVDIPVGETLTLACDLSADTLKSAGTLAFSGAAGLTVDAVSGSVSCVISGEVLKNQVYITAPAGSAITFPEETGVVEYSGKWESRDLDAFRGLVLKSDDANSITLYTGLYRSGDTDDHTAVTPYLTETVDGVTWYYYPNALGTYYVRGTRSGYIGIYQNIYMSEAESTVKTVEEITLEAKGTGGYVPSNVYINTSEAMENAWPSDISLFPEEYTKYMQNPTFREDRDAHRMTTGEELEQELAAMDQPDDNMYRYSLGTSLKGRDIPLVILTETDLSGAATLEEAAAALKNSDKLTVFYRAQMHGNEPAGGEGALAMLYKLQGGYADTLLDKIDLIVVPRLNPDGAYNYLRRLDDANDTDPNRDQMLLNTKEMQQMQRGYLLFDPEVVIDGHERMWNNQLGDMQISTSFTAMNSPAYQALALALDQAGFDSLEKAGLNGYYYAGQVNSSDPDTGSAYYSTAGSISVLVESRGIHESDEAMERRVVGQMAAITGVLDHLYENADEVKTLIATERATIAQKGATYEETDLFVLDTNTRTTTAADAEIWGNLNTVGQQVDWATGEVTWPTRYPSVADVAARTRTAPTAYVLPASLPNIQSILTLMERHGISWTLLPAGATLQLQHYGGDTTEATLSAEQLTRFSDGCYVFTMNTEKGLLLASLMEPDNTNVAAYQSTLAQRGYVGVEDICRYVRDLNAEGTVDYTVTEAEPVNITVYLDGQSGLDTNDGLTEATAVKTMEQAYSIMAEAMEGAGVGSQANLKILGLYEMGTTRVYMPSVSFPVTISGVTAADGISYTGGSTQETRIIDIGGPTTFQNMTIHAATGGNYNHINANGYKLVMGEGLTCTTEKTNAYFILAGGTYGSTKTVESTDLTVLSGNWRTIYAGGYLGHVSGEAKADISGCWVYQNIAVSLRGNAGSVRITVADTTVSDTVSSSAIYAGPIDSKNTSQGTVAGDVTITLGKNVTATAVYASTRDGGVINGTVTVIAAGADLSTLPVYAKCSAATGTTAAAVLKLGTDVTRNVTLDANLPLDLNGFDITGNVTVDGTLTVYDSATDDYDVSDGVYGQITGTVTGTLVAKDGYIAAADGFHKFGGQYISGVSLRPGNAGIYYSATVLADEILMAELETGVAVSLVDMPTADFATDEDTLYATGTNSVLVQNILTGDSEDADRAIMDIYAASYVKLPDGTVLVSDNTVAYSLYDILMLLKEQNPTAYESFTAQWQK